MEDKGGGGGGIHVEDGGEQHRSVPLKHDGGDQNRGVDTVLQGGKNGEDKER